jgi:hypothetical protein
MPHEGRSWTGIAMWIGMALLLILILYTGVTVGVLVRKYPFPDIINSQNSIKFVYAFLVFSGATVYFLWNGLGSAYLKLRKRKKVSD